ncbi:MAG: RNA polymerase sigma factor [Bacteroidales bacterium]|nr:RNA polymerase sigma factor [Bacteroidales bacterium]
MNAKEYNKIVEQHSDSLFRFALRYTADEEDSNDAVQESFVALWEHRDEVSPAGAKGWLMRVLYRLLVDRHRRVKRLDGLEERVEEGYNPHHQYELHDQLQQMLKQLPDIQRTLLLLRDLEGYSYKEMAEMTGLSEQQVMTYLYRARVKARKYLSNN